MTGAEAAGRRGGRNFHGGSWESRARIAEAKMTGGAAENAGVTDAEMSKAKTAGVKIRTGGTSG